MQGDMSSEVMPGVIIPLNEPEDRLAAFATVPNLWGPQGGVSGRREGTRLVAALNSSREVSAYSGASCLAALALTAP